MKKIQNNEEASYINDISYVDMAEEYADSFFQYDEPKAPKVILSTPGDMFLDDELPF